MSDDSEKRSDMMKRLLIIFPLVFILALAACRLATPGNSTPPVTQPTTQPPTQPTTQPATQPTTEPTQQTMPTETLPDTADLLCFIYKKPTPEQVAADKLLGIKRPNMSQCVEGRLYGYYYDWSEDEIIGKVFAICDESVTCISDINDTLYYVKESEPTALYSVPFSDLAQHTVIYESDFGAINFISTNWPYLDVLTLTEGNKRGVLLDLSTGEIDVLIEQYYLHSVSVEDMQVVDETRSYNRIWFKGKLSEEDSQKDYLYYIDTGKIIESYYQ